MQRTQLGVAADDFGLGPKQGLQAAARLGYAVVQLDATRGQIEPSSLSKSGERHLLRFVNGLGLDLATLGGHMGASGFTDPATLDQRINKTRQLLELAARLRVPVVTSSLGALPDDPDDRRRRSAIEAIEHLGEHADKTGTLLALQTAEDAPDALRSFLDGLACPMVRVCYDPGGLLIHGHDPVAGVEALADHIVASHLRDATAGTRAAAGREVRMGGGQLHLPDYLDAMDELQYAGPHIVRRTDATDPAADIAAAKTCLDDLLRQHDPDARR